jgi:hypothetical protein
VRKEKKDKLFFLFFSNKQTMNKMPPTSGVVAPVPLTASNPLATHLRDLYQMQAGSNPMHPGFGGGMPSSAGHLSALSAISMQHRQLLELHQRYLTASRLAAAAASAGGQGPPNGSGHPPPLTSMSAHSPSIIPPSRIQSSNSSGKITFDKCS